MLAIGVAGVVAGAINAVVGSGTLITFPTLLTFGCPPVPANVSNNIGLVPGVPSAAYAYRRELKGQFRRLIRLGIASLIGGLIGAFLLLELPARTFKAIVPVLILTACVLVLHAARQLPARLGECCRWRGNARGRASHANLRAVDDACPAGAQVFDDLGESV